MKSIKEKSNEYANEQGLRMAYNGSCDNCQQGFVVGANYVLDEIEKLTNNQNWCAFPKQSHKELKELIEQLKK